MVHAHIIDHRRVYSVRLNPLNILTFATDPISACLFISQLQNKLVSYLFVRYTLDVKMYFGYALNRRRWSAVHLHRLTNAFDLTSWIVLTFFWIYIIHPKCYAFRLT